jgi:hypothetical protein
VCCPPQMGPWCNPVGAADKPFERRACSHKLMTQPSLHE